MTQDGSIGPWRSSSVTKHWSRKPWWLHDGATLPRRRWWGTRYCRRQVPVCWPSTAALECLKHILYKTTRKLPSRFEILAVVVLGKAGREKCSQVFRRRLLARFYMLSLAAGASRCLCCSWPTFATQLPSTFPLANLRMAKSVLPSSWPIVKSWL